MPSIAIKDEQGVELLKTDLAGDGLGRYIKSAPALRGLAALARTLKAPLADAAGSRELALTLDADVPVGKSSELTISGGAAVTIGLHPSGSTLFEGSDLQAPVTVPNGTLYVSLSLEALLKAGLAGTAGQIGFGFQAGTALRYAYFHPIDIVGHTGSSGDAVKAMLSQAVFPADADDLARLPSGAYASLAGEGELSFRGQASLGSTTNLLATPGLPLIGAAALVQTGSVTVDAEWAASGEFELRVEAVSGTRTRLSFYRRRGRSLTVSAKALMGVSATVKDSDLIATLMKAISPNPEADLIALVNAGLDDEPILAIQRAIQESIDRSLTLSAQLQLSALRDDEALFAYDIDAAQLDAAGRAAVEQALHGQLGPIGQSARDAGPIRLVTSAERRLRERRTAWRINVLGILNVASFSELVRQGSLTYDPVSGALTAADQVSAKRIRVKSRPFESDAEKLRKVLFESLMVTAAYQAGRALGTTVTLTAEHTCLEQQGRTRRPDMEDHYRALIALGLCGERERDARLGGEAEFGASTFVIENRFGPAACDAMFLDAQGAPHPLDHYERIGRAALLAVIPADDPARSYRRIALEAEGIWRRVRELGGAIDRGLPGHISGNALKRGVVRSDVVTIVWWAAAMHRAARELAAMRTFLGRRDAAALAADAAFRKARTQLEKALASVVATTEAHFDDPWDMIAMDAAAARLGRLASVIISTRFAARYEEADVPAAPPARGAARGMRAATAARGGGGQRDWTADEQDFFSRHVVNLSKGKLSTGGSFSSSTGQVTRIFEELIPAYAAQQRAAGSIPRVMFYAHGGLVEEREGLVPVLARRRFWELNGIYPVYFVWETGLKETLKDIFDGLVPGRAARGPISDAVIEQLARHGREVWGQMKRSAETASASGGARLVAELAGRTWKALDGDIEYHALGHSAGSILHAHFLPLLVSQRPAGVPPVAVRTLHFLAPAITIDLFRSRLTPLVGSGKPITSLTMYTMTDELERADKSMKPYGKSLLYLVSGAFEEAVPTPILGMQVRLKNDLDMIRFWGLAGTQKVADVVFSKTSGGSPRARSESATHGGFDNDVATMTSVVRRVLDADDGLPVVDYFEETVAGIDRPGVGAPGEVPPAPRGVSGQSSAVRRAAAARPRAARKPWTVMVWMAGDNNLEQFGHKDLDEMKRVGSTDDVNVVVQFDSMQDDRTRRYYMTSAGTPEEDVVEELGETNTGDPAVAIDFFRWAIERYPAERLLGVIWNHGSGIDETDIYARAAARGTPVVRSGAAAAGDLQRNLVRTALSGRHRRAIFSTTVDAATEDRAIAYDDTSKDFLDNVELKKVLASVRRETGRTFDVLGFDACLMNMVEVAHQLKGTAGVVVGSEELEPGDGWPYHTVLEALTRRPDLAGPELAATIVRLYVESYSTGSVTQSALDLARLDDVAAAVDALAKALIKAVKDAAEYRAVASSLNATQRFDMADFVDLGHFSIEMAKRSRSAAVKAAARRVLAAVTGDDGFVLAEKHKGPGVGNATGAAIYFPRGPVNKVYGKLDFARETAWHKFLVAYHKV